MLFSPAIIDRSTKVLSHFATPVACLQILRADIRPPYNLFFGYDRYNRQSFPERELDSISPIFADRVGVPALAGNSAVGAGVPHLPPCRTAESRETVTGIRLTLTSTSAISDRSDGEGVDADGKRQRGRRGGKDGRDDKDKDGTAKSGSGKEGRCGRSAAMSWPFAAVFALVQARVTALRGPPSLTKAFRATESDDLIQ